MSGGIFDINWIDAEDPPIYNYHGTADDIVPYDFGFVEPFGVQILEMYGSKQINNRAESLGIRTQIRTVNGGTHTNIYGAGGYPYTYYGNIIATPLGSEGIGYTIGGILNEKNTNNNDSFTLRFLRINPYNKAGIGYPYAKQNILWASIGRSFSLPKQLGDLTAKLGYLYALQTGQNRLNSSPSLALTWTKNFY